MIIFMIIMIIVIIVASSKPIIISIISSAAFSVISQAYRPIMYLMLTFDGVTVARMSIFGWNMRRKNAEMHIMILLHIVYNSFDEMLPFMLFYDLLKWPDIRYQTWTCSCSVSPRTCMACQATINWQGRT